MRICRNWIIKNVEAIADVEAGKRTDANAAWWGFDPEDAIEGLQAAIDSGARRLLRAELGKDSDRFPQVFKEYGQ